MSSKKHEKLLTKYCDLGDVRIAYNEIGEGPTVLLIHPSSVSKDYWYDHRTTWLSGYRTIAIDSRGHGESISEDSVLSYEMIGKDVVAFCEKMGLKGCSVLGQSDGGIICLYLAAEKPGYFSKIASVSPNLDYGALTVKWKMIMKSVHVFVRLFSHFSSGVKRQKIRGDMIFMENYLPNQSFVDVGSELRVFYGDKDIAPVSHFEKMSMMMPKAVFSLYKSCTHMSIIKNDRFRDDLLKFL